mmetsp:Transcript_10098/g.11532  ORF Transcript_10098/g.11532 Transcript_10098/m.11532 type:complete len:273 (-) Transcript_10098:203-1021(-)
MKFILNVISLLAVGSVAASQQEVQHRLRGGVPASTKNVEMRRLDDTDGNATSSSTSSDYSNVATDMNATDASEDTEDSSDCASITETVCAMEGVTVFCELLQNPQRRHLGYMTYNSTSTDEDADAVVSSPTGASNDGTEDFASAFGFDDESEEFTLFVPTDAAFAEISEKFETLSDAEAGRVIMFHMYSGMMLTSDKLACSEVITSMNEMSDVSRTKCKNDGKKYQNGNGNTKTGSMPEINTADHMACNGVIHTLDHVMFPVSLSQLHADDA